MSDSAGAPWVIAHRGDHRQAPENSLASFDAAIRSGCDLIETDLRRCRDGIVMVHDAQAGGRPVAGLTRREIRAATGTLPPSLDDVVERCRGSIGLDLELKEDGLEAEVLDAVRPFFAPPEFLISSFRPQILSAVRCLDPSVRTGLLSARGLAPRLRSRDAAADPAPAAEVLAARRDCGADYLLPDALDDDLITQAAGTPLILWYANTAAEIRRALSRPAVAGVITDRPDLMQLEHSKASPARVALISG
jgi:glycerophosphoryl diester phosphodiesterase